MRRVNARVRLCVLLLAASTPSTALAVPVSPSGFALDPVTTGLGAMVGIALAPPSFGAYGGDLFTTVPATLEVYRVEPDTGASSIFAGPNGIQPGWLRFGPGGAFGEDLYVSSNRDPLDTDFGLIERVDAAGVVTRFGNPTPPPGPQSYVFGGTGLDFSLSGPFGTFLYSGSSAGELSDSISRIGSAGGASALFADFGTELAGSPTSMHFGPGGAFGTDLYVAMGVSGGGVGVESGIYRYDSSATRVAFSTVSSDPVMSGPIFGMAFSPGGAFGAYLYACDSGTTILRIDASGVAEAFVTGLADCFDLVFEPDGSALYFGERSTGTIWRLTPASVPALGAAARGSLLTLLVITALWTFRLVGSRAFAPRSAR